MSDNNQSDSPKGTKKPAGPPGTKKPAGPPAADTAADTKSPTLPPGFGGDGADGEPTLSKADFQSDQDVRWCPGCGDYAILSAVQRLLPELDVPKEDIVFISGIGCSGRFPYYVDTYGMHSIHGRAPAIATGLKTHRPELDVWVVTGDGDALSIGGNHLLHVLRRNVDLQILLFNNEIYGLTKGQYSPTSEQGKVTKSTPHGSLDRPLHPASVAFGAEGSFVARTMDRDPQHLKAVLRQSHEHGGTAFVEIYQNCNIFNDGAFFAYTDKETRPQEALYVEDGEPLTFSNGHRGLRLDDLSLEVIDLDGSRWSVSDCVVHDETDAQLGRLLASSGYERPELPRAFGVLHRTDRPTYEDLVARQIDEVVADKGKGNLHALLRRGDTWTVQA